LEAHDIPHAPIVEFEDLFDDPHLADVGFWQTGEHPSEGRVRWPRFPVNFDAGREAGQEKVAAAPRLGEHTDSILDGLGFSAAEKQALYADGVVASAGAAPHSPSAGW